MRKASIVILVLTFMISAAPRGFALTQEEETQLLRAQVKELTQRIEQLEQQQINGKEEAAKDKEELSKKFDSVKADLNNSLSETQKEDDQLTKAQVKELVQRIEQTEQQQAKSKEEAAKDKEELSKKLGSAKVDLNNPLSRLKLKGRAVAGFYDSGKAGSYPSGSFEVPDAKIQFGFQPDDINTIVMRLNMNNATAQSPLLDYFFLESKDFLPVFKKTPFSLSGRLGRFKLGFGEETWSDNSVEGFLPSNSAGKAGITDEAVELNGKIKLENFGLSPLGWVISVSDGNSGVGSDTSAGKAAMGKFYYAPIDALYLSGSYYDSGTLKVSNSEMSIAGLATRPTGATNWRRNVWEADARYDFGKGKKPLNPPAYSDSKAIARVSYGRFTDNATVDPVGVTRSGDFGFVDGIYNLTKKFYVAGRYSIVDLKGDSTATLNSVPTNRYERYSLGGGCHWTDNTILKLSYDWNKQNGAQAVEEADDNLLSAVVGAQF